MAKPTPPRSALPAVITKAHLQQAFALLNIPVTKLTSADIDPQVLRLTYLKTDETGKVITDSRGELEYTTYIIPVE